MSRVQDYFAWYNESIFALDTTPYSGGTTTVRRAVDGVPVLTTPGERPSSRSAASVLTTAGIASGSLQALRTTWNGPADSPATRNDSPILRATLRASAAGEPLMDEAVYEEPGNRSTARYVRTYCTQG
jgi:hypothetical protein